MSVPPQKLLDLAKKPLSVQETWETRYEQLMEQFASDMRLYMGMVSACGAACTRMQCVKQTVHCLGKIT